MLISGILAVPLQAKKPNIKLLATGGGISAAIMLEGASTGIDYAKDRDGASTLINRVIELHQIANISGEDVAAIASQEMTTEVWLKLARRVDKVAKSGKYDGIIITHGTDTIEETAYFLNLVINTHIPIVLVGASRPAQHLSPDGLSNLYEAVVVAGHANSYGKGVVVVMNGKIISARGVTKKHTYGTDAVSHHDTGFLGYVVGNKVFYYQTSTRKHTFQSMFDITKIKNLPTVDIVYGYADSPVALMNAVINNGAEGIVLAGVGNGNFHSNFISGFHHAHKKNIRIVRSTRTDNGIVLRNAEVNDDNPKFNFIAGDNLNPQKARILLMLALTKSYASKDIQAIFWTH